MATIQVRVSDDDKKKAEAILKTLGLDMTSAVRVFVKRIVIDHGIPFPVKHNLTVNGLTQEFEQGVLEAEKEEEGSVEFDNWDDALLHLDSISKEES